MILERELKFYESKKAEWLQRCPGLFVVIKGEELLGTFRTFDEAFEAGLEKWGNQPFLIKQVEETEPTVQHPALSVGLLHAHT